MYHIILNMISNLVMLDRQYNLFMHQYVETSFLPIAFIRDSLIPNQNRRKLKRYWDVVENKINTSKLVVCETRQIFGVKTYGWRLLSSIDDCPHFSQVFIAT